MTTATALSALTGTYAIDPTHTRIGFVARHAMVTKVRGGFNEFAGTARIDGDDLARSDVELTIQVASIDTRNADRDGHLRSNDFLALDEHPEITFRSTEVTPTDEGVDITGDLTIKGVTRSVTVPFTFEGQATDPFGNERIGFEGATTINRKDYGLTWNAALETGGVLVSEKIVLEFEVSAIRQA
ncbi:polyisoprenoid-binding protein [Pseudonocardia sulfidoxydans NBRC 16205]|uniref:Polyisoprenoid-binding protein n=1 Tax=Pseudonocardia sulfidoxydans NBRC 16205 TaxID=1223511 RepID=A0A511DH24_9PSEU|nr:YceI family protein [Pseudonocardia sulfidoxydans]GEL23054.1 polyisoprenoid-binding protein [Pseudonocardia sulfidoxydans NBRC 16205]